MTKKTLSYGTLNFQQLDLYEPLEYTNTLIFIHGGAWRQGNKEMYQFIGQQLPQRRIFTIIIGYRLSHQSTVYHPLYIQDCIQALEYLRNTNIVKDVHLCGHSVGAQICSLLALHPIYKQPNITSVIGIEGIYHIPKLYHKYPQYIDFIEQALGRSSLVWKDASPELFCSNSEHVPILVVHSTQDELVDVEHSAGFYSRLINANSQLVISSFGKHDEMLHSSRLYGIISEWLSQ